MFIFQASKLQHIRDNLRLLGTLIHNGNKVVSPMVSNCCLVVSLIE